MLVGKAVNRAISSADHRYATVNHGHPDQQVRDTSAGGYDAFAARNHRLRLIEGGELKHLLAEHLNLDVRIDLSRRPRRAT